MNNTHIIDVTTVSSLIFCQDGDTLSFKCSSSNVFKYDISIGDTIQEFESQDIYNTQVHYDITISPNINILNYTCKLYYTDTTNITTTTTNIYVYPSHITSTLGTLNLINTQLIDNQNNHIFCIFETNNNNIVISTLKQVANRVISYQQRKIDELLNVFSTFSTNLICAADNQNYDIEYNVNTRILFVPLSANVYTVPAISPVFDGLSSDAHCIDKLATTNTVEKLTSYSKTELLFK